METARRMKYFRKPAFADLKACTGPDPIDFTLGSPDIAPEPSIMEAIQKAAGEPQNYKYAVTALPQLIQAVQDWYHDRYSTDLDPEEICLLQGSQEALINLPLVFCNPHDGILIPDPYYPVYEQAPRLAGADVLYMPLKPENHYLPDLEDRKSVV